RVFPQVRELRATPEAAGWRLLRVLLLWFRAVPAKAGRRARRLLLTHPTIRLAHHPAAPERRRGGGGRGWHAHRGGRGQRRGSGRRAAPLSRTAGSYRPGIDCPHSPDPDLAA